MTPDGLLVPCEGCGAPCTPADVERVTCSHCGAKVPVPEHVRMFIQGLHGHALSGAGLGLQLAQFQAVATGAPVPSEDTWEARRVVMEVERVRGACPNCGLPQEYGGRDRERCPACGAESVGPLAGTVKIMMRWLATANARRAAMEAIALHVFPLGKRGPDGTWRCGACAAPLGAAPSSSSQELEHCAACGKNNTGHVAGALLAMCQAVVAGLTRGTSYIHLEAKLHEKSLEVAEAVRKADDARRRLAEHQRKNPHAMLRFWLTFPAIALATWIGYHIDLALRDPPPLPTTTYTPLPIPGPIEFPIPMPGRDEGPDAAADAGSGAGDRSGVRPVTRRRAGPGR